MSDHAAATTLRANPALAGLPPAPPIPGPLPALEQYPPPPLRIRRAAVATSALSAICSWERWRRWAADMVDPAGPDAIILADHLFRVFGLGPTGGAHWMRPIIAGRGQNLMHLGDAPAAPVPAAASLLPARRDLPPANPHAPVQALPAATRPVPAGDAPAVRQDRMHHETAATPGRRGLRQPVSPGQDRMHREVAPAALPAPAATPAAGHGGPDHGGQNPMHRETTISGPIPTPRPTRKTAPPVDADARGCTDVTRSEQQDPIHRENRPPAHPALAQPPRAQRQNPRHPEQARSAARTLDPARSPTPGAPRTGPLRNGNPHGNPNAAPRCGARTRSGCPCRAPALRNKLRCRMHGGASTGPRTAEGLQRLRDARTTHGRYAAPRRAHCLRILTFLRCSRVQLAAARYEEYLPPLARARFLAFPPEWLVPPCPSPSQAPLSRAQARAIVAAQAAAHAPWKHAIAFAKASKRLGAAPPEQVRALDALFAALPPAILPTPPFPAARTPCTVTARQAGAAG
jgi:hypothetical protein